MRVRVDGLLGSRWASAVVCRLCLMTLAASYGSMARFPDVQRLRQVSDGVIIGASGEMSDFDFAMRLLDELR